MFMRSRVIFLGESCPIASGSLSLSENSRGSQSNEGELKVQEADVVGLFPADQQAAGAIDPGMGAFNFPTASFTATTFGAPTPV